MSIVNFLPKRKKVKNKNIIIGSGKVKTIKKNEKKSEQELKDKIFNKKKISIRNFPKDLIKMRGRRAMNAGVYGPHVKGNQSISLRERAFGNVSQAFSRESTIILPKGVAKAFRKKKIRTHEKIAPYLEAALQEIENNGLSHLLHSWEGSYANRNVRGGSSKSFHAYGAAFDINYNGNELENDNYKLDPRIVRIFKKHGFAWGGEFHSRSDAMHFEASNAMMKAIIAGKYLRPDNSFLDPDYKKINNNWNKLEGEEPKIKNGYYSNGKKTYNRASTSNMSGNNIGGSYGQKKEGKNPLDAKLKEESDLTKSPSYDYTILNTREILAYVLIPGFNEVCKGLHLEDIPLEYEDDPLKNVIKKNRN